MKVTTLNFIYRGKEVIKFTYEVNVNKAGKFTTTLPKEAVRLIESYGVTLNENRAGNAGFFSSDTMDGLASNIYKAVEEAVSCELVGTEDVIKYQIMICASYCRNRADETDAELYPNGMGLNGNYMWKDGNVHDGLSKRPISFSVYVKPTTIKRYRYKSGRERIEECSIEENNYPQGSAIRFLAAIANTAPDRNTEVKQMPCTEKNAEFFRRAVISIWKLNEALGEILKEDTLEMAIKNQKLLIS